MSIQETKPIYSEKEIENDKTEINFSIPSNIVNEKKSSLIKEINKNASIKGFRKGKIPIKVIEKNYKKYIDSELSQHIQNIATQTIISDSKQGILDISNFSKPIQEKDNKNFSVKCNIIKSPDFEIPKLDELNIGYEKKIISDDDVNQYIEQQIIPSFSKLNDANDREIQKDDIVTYSYTASHNGKPLKEILPELTKYTQGTDKMVSIIEENSKNKHLILPFKLLDLVGKKINEEFELKYTFPNDFENSDLKEKEITTKIKIEKISSVEKPILNEDFFQDKFKMSEKEYKNLLKTELANQNENIEKDRLDNIIVDKITEKCNFDIPKATLHDETQRVVDNLVKNQYKQGVKENEVSEQKNKILEEAKQTATVNAKRSIVIGKLLKHFKISVTQEDMLEEIKKIAHKNNSNIKDVYTQLQKNNSLQNLESQLSIRKLLDVLIQKVNLNKQPNEKANEKPELSASA